MREVSQAEFDARKARKESFRKAGKKNGNVSKERVRQKGIPSKHKVRDGGIRIPVERQNQ